LQRLKDIDNVRTKYGGNLKESEINERLVEEANMKQIRKVRAEEAEANRLLQIKIDTEIRALAVEMVKNKSLLISLDGLRVKAITPDLLILCTHCGKPLDDLMVFVRGIADLWYWTPENERLEAFRIFSAKNPLMESGFPGFVGYTCPRCRKSLRVIAQMVMI